MRADELEALFQDHAARLFGFLLYRTGDRALAEDIVGDTFERAFRARTRFRRGKGAKTTWLYAIALNRLRDLKRREAVESQAVSRVGANAPSEAESFEDRVAEDDELGEALRGLPANEREAIALRFGADLTVPEVAAVLEEPLARVEGRVYRGLRKLRSELTPP